MIKLKKRINAFAELGKAIIKTKDKLIDLATNPWFTEDNVSYATDTWTEELQKEKLERWCAAYPGLKEKKAVRKVGVITAGNIPLVGFHDFMSVLLSGHIFVGKLSSKNNRLLPAVAQSLKEIEPEFADYIRFEDERLTDFDAIIATGSNNSARYFDAYFGKYPHIIRKNRNSAAVLSGKESDDELKALADDIFLYFGLGCRNVSKIFVPTDFNTNRLFENFIHKKDIINHNKYANNYDYNRAVYLMNSEKFLDNGFMLLKESQGYASPVSVVYYERYDDLETLKTFLSADAEKIQCLVSRPGLINGSIPFGHSQKPALNDYADGRDTLEFLLNLQ
jgi:hypothetical protein